MDVMEEVSSGGTNRALNKRALLKYGMLGLAVTAIVVTVAVIEAKRSSDLKDLLDRLPAGDTASDSSHQDVPLKGKYQLAVIKPDNLHQNCQGSDFKLSFADVDYALLGYNILRGYPLATGHDPGFTLPIFRADYSSGGQTADCRYSVPDGLVIIPDVSCITSFTSTTVRNKFEFAKALSTSAHVEGGGWGVKFSASAGYKKSSSEIAKGESVYIISTAKCHYYFSKLITDAAPRFDDVFMQWLHKLNNTHWKGDGRSQTYIDFLDRYGTHFPTEVTFGASYTYEYTMSAQDYQTKTESGVNVAAEASYSGLFSIGGGFSLDSSQKQSASEFSKSVQTKTITIGAAPPANGDAMTWASEVKTSPVPTSYKLASIESLFTDEYMKTLNIGHSRIRKNIENQKYRYCQFLQVTGQVESCRELAPGITLERTKLQTTNMNTSVVVSISDCLEQCLQNVNCAAMSYCVTCSSNVTEYKTCYMFKEINSSRYSALRTDDTFVWQSYIFSDKVNYSIEFVNTAIVGVARGLEDDNDKKASKSRCEELCMNDAYCVAYSHCDCTDKVSRCQLYSEGQVKGLYVESGTKTSFISSRFYGLRTTTMSPNT
ncbi:perivitellin-2 67 kDa subunit-like [Mercenaria mercenaria]|uniref:perivitellin-2 67 kDa subunit-like n=1 Tax=Mercenaria mercenaria TaxID=6596 RepID=UPI00234E653E|nr:perivitellin-2 67 kDa subunit-like [Mercenaria mercenaria]